MRQIILASQSARRQELLKLVDIPYEICVADIDETIDFNLNLEDELKRIALNKAQKVFELHPEAIIIAADTVVSYQNKILGKPKDEQEAYAMLKMLSGSTHQVISACAILSKERCENWLSVTDVQFYPLTDEQIINYINTNEPMDKAGAYGIQGKGCVLVEKIDGDYYTVVGLPIAQVVQQLKKFEDDE